MKERWKKFADGVYAISDYGRLMRIKNGRCTKAGRILLGSKNLSGYCQVSFRFRGKYFSKLVHSLVARAFIGPCPDGKEVNHIDGNKDNNRVENLEYITRSENARHAFRLGLRSNVGEKHSRAILTEEAVKQIRREYIPYKKPARVFADYYGVSRKTVYSVITGKSWRHLEREGNNE